MKTGTLLVHTKFTANVLLVVNKDLAYNLSPGVSSLNYMWTSKKQYWKWRLIDLTLVRRVITL